MIDVKCPPGHVGPSQSSLFYSSHLSAKLSIHLKQQAVKKLNEPVAGISRGLGRKDVTEHRELRCTKRLSKHRLLSQRLRSHSPPGRRLWCSFILTHQRTRYTIKPSSRGVVMKVEFSCCQEGERGRWLCDKAETRVIDAFVDRGLPNEEVQVDVP